MNKIVLEDLNIISSSIDDSITYDLVDNDVLGIKVLNISVVKSCDLSLDYKFTDSKLEVCISVLDDVVLGVNEIVNGCSAKVRTKYSIGRNSSVNVFRFNNIDSIKEYFICNLDGEGASINYNLKTISINPENYDFLIYHNFKNTNSNINTNGVSIKDGSILFNVSSFIPKNITGCVASQDNRIINLNDNECIIKPNLYIDCDDVIANHSAWVGSFSDDDLFYLQSRGINRDDATRLLIKGFLTSNMSSEMCDLINSVIDDYWR
jgi:Fe-S cluster assembly scaffold protein SufB